MKNMKVCKMGLESIWINRANGEVRMCGWTDYNIGSLLEYSIEELWNGEKAEKFRESMLDGSYSFCNCKECPHMANNKLDSMLVEYNVPMYPKFCNLSYEEQCNYVCVFCRTERYIPKPCEKENFKKIEGELNKFIGQLDTLASNGVGELFCSDHTLGILSNINTDKNLKVELESNGSLFNEKNWNKISNLGKYDLTVYITVHSFNEKTYQYLSGTTLPVTNVIDNLHFIKSLREKGIINHFEIATVICERNFREMPEYVKRCLEEFNPDRIRLRFFKSYGRDSEAIEWFYDVRNPHHPYNREFIEVMKDPIFNHPKVWKWQGDTESALKEHPYFREHNNYMVLSKLMAVEKLHERLKCYFKQNGIQNFALYCNGYVCKAFATLLNEIGIQFGVVFDSNMKILEKECKGHSVVNPDAENVSEFDAIIITSPTHYLDVKEKLNYLGYNGIVINIDDLANELNNC